MEISVSTQVFPGVSRCIHHHWAVFRLLNKHSESWINDSILLSALDVSVSPVPESPPLRHRWVIVSLRLINMNKHKNKVNWHGLSAVLC